MATTSGAGLTGGEVADWLQLDASARAQDTATLAMVAGAATSFVNDHAPHAPRDEDDDWTESTRLGATMLAARLYRRRNSPNGIEAMGDLGTSYVSRYDSDIARLLRIDAYQGPAVG